MLAWILIAVLACGSVESLLGWGAEGHRAIGALAQEMISSQTRAKVQLLLDECGYRDLASASTWADEVRENARSDKPRPKDAEDFNRRFPSNPTWHFVDLPLGTGSLAEVQQFMPSQNDVIHATERCISVLENPTAEPGNLSRSQALRLLVHLVGDIHQPLHCGAGFYQISDTELPVLVTNPQKAFGLPNDRGGNDLFYGPKAELHALWDIDLVEEIADTFDFRILETTLRPSYLNHPWASTPGDYHHWPEAWALESVGVAKSAYSGIQFNSVESMGEPNRLWISISLPSGYEEKNRVLAAQQLSKAAVRLAQLLNRLQWP